MDWKLEVVPLPVADVDRAKAFYRDKVGFNLDFDHEISDSFRVVQLTPPGSACSIVLGTGMLATPPGSVQGLHLVVADIHAARAQLAERGVEVSEVQTFSGDVGNLRDRPPVSYAYFQDPDGNGWAVQQLPAHH